METRRFTRPTILMLTNGYMRDYLRATGVNSAEKANPEQPFGPLIRFVPQKTVALQRLVTLGLTGTAFGLIVLVWLVRELM
jgi:hypothetical protein